MSMHRQLCIKFDCRKKLPINKLPAIWDTFLTALSYLIFEIEFKKTVESNVDLLLSIVAYGISFLTAIFVRVQIQRRMYTSWVYALFALVLSSFLSFAVLERSLNNFE